MMCASCGIINCSILLHLTLINKEQWCVSGKRGGRGFFFSSGGGRMPLLPAFFSEMAHKPSNFANGESKLHNNNNNNLCHFPKSSNYDSYILQRALPLLFLFSLRNCAWVIRFLAWQAHRNIFNLFNKSLVFLTLLENVMVEIRQRHGSIALPFLSLTQKTVNSRNISGMLLCCKEKQRSIRNCTTSTKVY